MSAWLLPRSQHPAGLKKKKMQKNAYSTSSQQSTIRITETAPLEPVHQTIGHIARGRADENQRSDYESLRVRCSVPSTHLPWRAGEIILAYYLVFILCRCIPFTGFSLMSNTAATTLITVHDLPPAVSYDTHTKN